MHSYDYDRQVIIYGYVEGNPVSFIDPLGLDVLDRIADRVAGVGSGSSRTIPTRDDGKPRGAGCGDESSERTSQIHFQGLVLLTMSAMKSNAVSSIATRNSLRI